MASPPYRSEPLRDHDRSSFFCGVDALDRYFRHQISQDIRRKIAAAYVLVDLASDRIAGFYTLSAFAVEPRSLPPNVLKRLPHYELVPAILIGRLAVDQSYQGKGVGRQLLSDALERCVALARAIGAFAVIIDAKNEDIQRFYEKTGFRILEDHPGRLYLLIAAIEKTRRS